MLWIQVKLSGGSMATLLFFSFWMEFTVRTAVYTFQHWSRRQVTECKCISKGTREKIHNHIEVRQPHNIVHLQK